MLEQEIKYFTDHLSEWLERHSGKFTLIKEQELIGFFDTIELALADGARRFGLQPFLVRRVIETQETINIPALLATRSRSQPGGKPSWSSG